MPSFSEADINAAKRRVQEMRNRAQRFADEDNIPPVHSAKQETPPPVDNAGQSQDNDETEDETAKSDEKSFFVILALIFLLSKEGADNTLILALLYLLL